jgi:hypothetical protein
MHKPLIFAAAVAALNIALGAAAPSTAHAWGATGHEWVSGVGAELLPEEVPAFLRTKAAAATIAEYGREPDRSKSSGVTHDKERDPAHFIDLFDDGKAMGIVPAPYPETRGEYDKLLRAGGSDQYLAGYLPYAIVDGYQQLVKDFAWWRASTHGAKHGRKSDRAYFKADAKRREQLLIRDLGVLTHYLGDASQPHHTSIHYGAWGEPNPKGYTQERMFHNRFEGVWVKANLNRADVRASVPAFRDCACPIMQRATDFIFATNKLVEPLFEMEKRRAFPAPLLDSGGEPIRATITDPEAAALSTKQLALSAAEVRDLTVLAWRESATSVVGYPGVRIADVESGKIVLTKTMYAND